MKKNIIFIAILLVTLAGLTYTHEADPGVESNLITLTEENFANFVNLNGSDTWFIMFFAPWCGHCKRAMPAWTEFSTKVKGKYNVATVDCDQHKSLRDRFGVQGFPTFILVKDKKMIPYKGARTIDAWTSFVEGGYLNVTAEEIPSGPSVWRNVEKFIEGIANQMQRLYKQDFTMFAIIVGVLALTCILTIWCAVKLGGDDDAASDIKKVSDVKEGAAPATEESKEADGKEKKD